MRLMFNRYSKSFHLAFSPFAFLKPNQRVGLLGKAVKLSPCVYALITKRDLETARQKCTTDVPVVVTKWPRVKLVMRNLKEIFDHAKH